MNKSSRTLPARALCVCIGLGALSQSTNARADIPLNDPAKADGWGVSMSGQVNAYLSWVFGETVNRSSLGNLVDPDGPSTGTRYRLVGPQITIQGNPTPSGPLGSPVNDTDINTPRIRGGFASTVLNFMVAKQLLDDLKLDMKFGFWAGIDNAAVGGVRQKNDIAPVDFREQFVDLSGSWGTVWGGRKVGLYNRGGMRMNWILIHQHGVGHPCNVDGSGTATCGHTGVGSMFPNRNAQIGYATPLAGGFQLSVAMFDPAHVNEQWNRGPLPRFETEATFKREFGGPKDLPNELNVWANGLTQPIGRTQEIPPQPAIPPAVDGNPGVPADAVRTVYGVGGGTWGRISGFALGGTAWYGAGLGTATPFGNTAVDDVGELRKHFGYLAIANFRIGNFEVAASYGSTNVRETDWDKNPDNPDKISVIKQVSGIGGKLAYHVAKAVIFSVDGIRLNQTWWRGESLDVNVVSGGFVARF